MDQDKLKRRQSLKVIISEAIMVLVVIITVVILAFVVSGYWVNTDFKVERQGLLQVYSTPTGANVEIDGKTSWLQRTNTSKTLSSGKHTITLTKDGYDSWKKEINLAEGLLYRLHYPRLFLKDRTIEKVSSTAGTLFATISPDHHTLVLINGTTNWPIINLEEEKIEPKKLNVSEYFSNVSVAEGANTGLLNSEVLSANWDVDSSHVLLQASTEDNTEWVLIDVKNPKNSINLTREFGANFTKVKILDNSSSSLLVVQNQNLHKIDIQNKSLSAVLVENIVDFDHYGNRVIFSAVGQGAGYCIGLLKIGDGQAKVVKQLDNSAKVAIFKFYEDIYSAIIRDTKISLYKEPDFTKVSDYTISFLPDHVKVGQNGEFLILRSGSSFATLDMEASAVREWETSGSDFGWLDNNMIYSVSGGELSAYDFDGLNQRVLSKNVSDHFPAAITNDKWLYYFSDDSLVREWLIPR